MTREEERALWEEAYTLVSDAVTEHSGDPDFTITDCGRCDGLKRAREIVRKIDEATK